MATSKLKQFAILGSALALLGGCASQQEQPAEAQKEAAARAAVEKKAAEEATARAAVEKKAAEEATARAAVEKKAAEEATARAAVEKKAAEEAEAKRRAAPKIASLKSTGLFDFDKSALRPDAKAALDKDVVARKDEVKSVKSVIVDGHADRLGSQEYNQRLSEKRAEVAKAYLVGKGVPANSIETNGFGKTQPATGASVQKCEDSLGRKKLIECLQPHRRVVVELKGEAK